LGLLILGNNPVNSDVSGKAPNIPENNYSNISDKYGFMELCPG
jgi:hypothetical protein